MAIPYNLHFAPQNQRFPFDFKITPPPPRLDHSMAFVFLNFLSTPPGPVISTLFRPHSTKPIVVRNRDMRTSRTSFTRSRSTSTRIYSPSACSRVPSTGNPHMLSSSINFLPDDRTVDCSAGDLVLEVALREGIVQEDKYDPFCRDGGCYKCEMEIDGQLVRTCQFRVPKGRNIQVLNINTDEVWNELAV